MGRKDVLIVSQMPFNNISNSQMRRGDFTITKLQELFDRIITPADDEICSRMHIDSIPNSLTQNLDIMLRHSIGISQDDRDFLRHSHLCS